MKKVVRTLLCVIVAIASIGSANMVRAQEKSANFAHVSFPDEVKAVAVNPHNAFARGYTKLWRINTDNWTIEQIDDVRDKGWSTQIQGVATDNDNVYYYVNGEGIYQMPVDGNSAKIVTPASDEFKRNYEEAYSAMNIDPTGRFLLLYGFNENAAMFDLKNGVKPVSAYNDYVSDAYWLNNMLWAAALDKVVINTREGRSMDNQDFIYYGSNDQHGITKIFLNNENILPNMGEVEMSLGDSGELVRLIYNKANGDLLLCTGSFTGGTTKVYKLTADKAETPKVEPVAEFKKQTKNIAAYGNKIFAYAPYEGLTEVEYGTTFATPVKTEPIITDIMKPAAWSGAKPEPYKIKNITFMDFDNDGNLWLVNDRDLFVCFKKGKK